MAEPLSTLATALQIAEVAAGVGVRITRFVHDLKEVDVTTAELSKKLDHLQGVVTTIESVMKHRNAQSSIAASEDETKALSTTESLLRSCDKDIEAFGKILTPLKPSGRGNRVYRVATQMSTQARLEWNERYISRLEKSLQGNIILLQTLCTCSEVTIQGDAVYRLAGSNEDIARSQAKMQEDIAKLRSTMERFTRHGKTKSSDIKLNLSPVPESFEEADHEEEIIGRLKTAIEVTESLCDKVSSLGSVSDVGSTRIEVQRGSSNASTVEGDSERNRLLLARTRIDTPDTPQSSFATANSVLDDISTTRLSSPDIQDIDPGDIGYRLRPTTSLHALPLTVMEKMLENYQSQARQNLGGPSPQYEEAERNLLRSLECGLKREQAYEVAFKERFDIVIELAKAQIGQGKFKATEETLEILQTSVGEDQDKLARWSCTSATLYQKWFSRARDVKLLSHLEQFAMQAYNVASKSSAPNQNLEDSAEALIAFFAWNGDDVAVKTLCTYHPSASVPEGYVVTQDIPEQYRKASKMPSSRARESISEMLASSTSERSCLQSSASGPPLGKATSAPEANTNLLLLAAKSKSVDLVRYHVKQEDVNSRDKRRRTALHLALQGAGGKEVVMILLENGADVDAADAMGTTPLHICSDLDKNELAGELIRKGAKVDALDLDAETPLQLAVRKRRLRMVQCLLKAGASVENISRQSGSKEIDYLIKEHLDHLAAPSRSRSGGRLFGKRQG